MLSFDEHGYLTPEEPIEVDYETFVKTFVVNEHRSGIFEEYQSLMEALSDLSLGAFYQWINGSFITRQARPKDIDVVTFVDFQAYETFDQFFREIRKKYSKVDIYFVKEYPKDHPKRFVTDFDKIE